MHIDALPPPTRTKLVQLRQQLDDDKALLASAVAAVQESETRCMQLAAIRDRATTEEAIKAAMQQLDDEREGHGRLVERRQQREAQHRLAALIHGRCVDWIERQPAYSRLHAVPVTTAKAFNADQFEGKRRDIDDLKHDLERVAASPLDRQSLKAAVEQHVSALAESCQLRLAGKRGDAPFEVHLEARAGGLHVPKPLELLAWWDAKGLTARLLAAIPEVDGMSLADKATATARLKAELLKAERAEEALIKAALEEGKVIARRPDADPRAVLGVAVISAELAAA